LSRPFWGEKPAQKWGKAFARPFSALRKKVKFCPSFAWR
jgi:hypothetical protein